MEAEVVSIECLFLHDTQMADLEREQARLRAFASETELSRGTDRGWFPAAFAQAFCPLAAVPAGTGKLTVGAPEACEGWIIRPVAFERAESSSAAVEEEDGRYAKDGNGSPRAMLPSLPGFPPFPRQAGFILGHAAPSDPERAEGLAAEFAARLADEAAAKAFTVNVWYEATLTLEILRDKKDSYGFFAAVGKPTWKKLTPFSSI